MSDSPSVPPKQPRPRDVNRARRLLLKRAAYVAPVVLGLLEVRTAMAQTPSCAPATCQPATCQPSTGPCQPNSCKPRQP